MSWIGYVLGFFGLLIATPIIFVGYIELVKKDQKREITEMIEYLNNKNKLTEQERLFVVIAQEHLNNLEKNKVE